MASEEIARVRYTASLLVSPLGMSIYCLSILSLLTGPLSFHFFSNAPKHSRRCCNFHLLSQHACSDASAMKWVGLFRAGKIFFRSASHTLVDWQRHFQSTGRANRCYSSHNTDIYGPCPIYIGDEAKAHTLVQIQSQ
jgi:hypothetical protein